MKGQNVGSKSGARFECVREMAIGREKVDMQHVIVWRALIAPDQRASVGEYMPRNFGVPIEGHGRSAVRSENGVCPPSGSDTPLWMKSLKGISHLTLLHIEPRAHFSQIPELCRAVPTFFDQKRGQTNSTVAFERVITAVSTRPVVQRFDEGRHQLRFSFGRRLSVVPYASPGTMPHSLAVDTHFCGRLPQLNRHQAAHIVEAFT